MATAYRLATMASARSVASRPNSVLRRTMAAPKPIPTFPFSSSTSPLPRAASRVVAAMGSVESMMPLHSAIASARLRSSIAFDSSCWSFLSQGRNTFLSNVLKPYFAAYFFRSPSPQ